MKKRSSYVVTTVRYGSATVFAESPEEAAEIVNDLDPSCIEWSPEFDTETSVDASAFYGAEDPKTAKADWKYKSDAEAKAALLSILESEDVRVEEYDECVEIGFASPAGEDFSFTVDPFGDDLALLSYSVDEFYKEFDPEEHVESVRGMNGAPGLFELCEDAKAIEETLGDLANLIHEFYRGYEVIEEDEEEQKVFDVTITETLKRTVSVEASSKEEAEQMVCDRWHADEYQLDADNFIEVEFEAHDKN